MRLPRARRLFKLLLRALLAAAVLFVTAAITFAIHCSRVRGHFQPSPPSQFGKKIPGYARSEDGTFLTYPEWYIVWSYQEKAAWQKSYLPSGFRFFHAIGEYWSGYCCSYGVVRSRYAFNFGDHLMLAVIGTSFSVEYALKGIYEGTVGRLSEWTAGHEPTEEDRYAATVAHNYGQFVEDRPWYEFRFFPALGGLWSGTGFWGKHVLRKWERKAWLTADYTAEGIYGGLMTLASHAVYGVEEDTTYAVVDSLPDSAATQIHAIRTVQALGNDRKLVRMPRYQKFTGAATDIARAGGKFVEIAGNRQIMVTAIVPRGWTPGIPDVELLFTGDVLTGAQSERAILRLPVTALSALLAQTNIEHIYDY